MGKRNGRLNRSWKSESLRPGRIMTREDAIREEKPGRQNSGPCLCGAQMQTNTQSSFGETLAPAPISHNGTKVESRDFLPPVWLGHSCPRPLTLMLKLGQPLPLILKLPVWQSEHQGQKRRTRVSDPHDHRLYLSICLGTHTRLSTSKPLAAR
jgi:hypothetical protein